MTTPPPGAGPTPPPPPSPGLPDAPVQGGVPSSPAPDAAASSPSVAQDVGAVAGQVLSQAPALESVIAGLPQPARVKAAALKIAAELHAGMAHLFSHHSISDLIKDAKEIEVYLSEGLDKIGPRQ